MSAHARVCIYVVERGGYPRGAFADLAEGEVVGATHDFGEALRIAGEQTRDQPVADISKWWDGDELVRTLRIFDDGTEEWLDGWFEPCVEVN